MNVFGIIILAALIADFALDTVAELLNMRSSRLELPVVLAGIYKPEDYRRSQEYLRVNTRLSVVRGAFGLAVILAFWFAGGFAWLEGVVKTIGTPFPLDGVLYIAILGLGYAILGLPFTIYDTFVVEQRFGFNRSTPRTFVADRLKGLMLALVLGVPFLAGILALFQFTGAFAWLYCWAAVAGVIVGGQYIVPTLIMPLFNKFTPLAEGELRAAITQYAGSVGFPIKNILVMDSSRRSSKSNAFFTGFGRNKRIVLFDTLIAQHPTPELVSILAHEIGHYKKKHILQGTLISIAHMGLVLFLLSLFVRSQGLYAAFYLSDQPVYAGLLFFALLYTPLEMVLGVAVEAFSRAHEADADRFAAQTVSEPSSYVDALKKLHASNLSNMTPHPFYVFLKYSHPPLLERVRTVEGVRAARQAQTAGPG